MLIGADRVDECVSDDDGYGVVVECASGHIGRGCDGVLGVSERRRWDGSGRVGVQWSARYLDGMRCGRFEGWARVLVSGDCVELGGRERSQRRDALAHISRTGC